MPAGHVARKRFGQHFLADPRIIERIVAELALAPDDNVLEVGPGLGALTAPLLQRLERLQVIEIDRDLAARLRATYPPQRLAVVEGDALEVDLARFGDRLRLVGNLPYNVSSPLLFHFADHAERLRDITVMLQKEVVDRMAAAPGSAAYGRLSVMLQWRFEVDPLFDVPPQCFRPPPQVMSAVARLTPKPPPDIAVTDPLLFARIVAAAFGQRRKTLRNTLRGIAGEDDLRAADIDPALRGEALGHLDFARLAAVIRARDPLPGAAA